MESSARCPFCDITLPPSELQRHANSHFEDRSEVDCIGADSDADAQFARDLELAERLSAESSSVPLREDDVEHQIASLRASQMRSSFYHVKDNGGIMALLCKRLEVEARHDSHRTTFLSGYVDHFQSLPSEDSGWGCGWRNIQMLSSHLLSRRREAGAVLFGGGGFVPDIPFLQRWLEIAWEKGFDTPGSHHFNRSIYGSQLRIGTTECAALFRSFGLRARIVDFGPKELESLLLSVPGATIDSRNDSSFSNGKRKSFRVDGPMDRYLTRTMKDEASQPSSSADDKLQCSRSFTRREDKANTSKNPRRSDSHRVLLEWVWNYFSGEMTHQFVHQGPVIVTDKAPLYFQHDGHSRTIVGIQLRHQKNGPPKLDLLILDPGHIVVNKYVDNGITRSTVKNNIPKRTEVLERSLKGNDRWGMHIKRGLHTLKKPQYQLCYIDHGIAYGQEMEQLKTMDSVFIELE